MDELESRRQRVDALLVARAEARRLREARARMEPDLVAARDSVRHHSEVVAAEQADVDRLTGRTLSRVLAGLSGSLTDREARERAEAERARYLLADAQAALARLTTQADRIEGDLGLLGDVESAYQEALSDLLLAARVSMHASAGDIEADAERRLATIQRRREVDEALAAAAEALPRLREARRRCGKAADWATADLFGGLGVLDDLMKYDHLDAAVSEVRAAGGAMQRLSRELADVDLPGLEAPVLDSVDRGIDVWLDNIFTDHDVRRRIQQAVRDLDRAVDEVERTITRLEQRRAELAHA